MMFLCQLGHRPRSPWANVDGCTENSPDATGAILAPQINIELGGGGRDMVAQYFFPEGNVGFGSSATTLPLLPVLHLRVSGVRL